MAYYNIHFSPTGGTKKVACILASALAGEYTEIDLCKDISPMTLNRQDVCLISVPSYGGRVPAIALERLKSRGDRKAAEEASGRRLPQPPPRG